MFGYVQPYIPDLTVGDYEYYRAAYCGLCRSMDEVCGGSSRMTLSYDGVFLSLLRMLLTDERPECEQHHCPYAPLARKNIIESAISAAHSPTIQRFRSKMGMKQSKSTPPMQP